MNVRSHTTLLMLALALLVARVSFAQPAAAYPAKPVRLIVGLAPGGATDVQARWFAQSLTEAFGRPVIIDNRAGAGGLIAGQLAAAAAPDGYTLLAATPAMTIAPAMHETGAIDPVNDLAPISLLTKAPFFVVVTPAFPATTLKDLIAYARARPEQLLVGVAGGTAIHLGAVWLAQATNTRMTFVTYKGNAPVMTDLLAGQVHVSLANGVSAFSLLKAGRLRALAVTTMERSGALPDLPTVAESGVPGYDVNTWHGWLAPKKTPRAIIMQLNAALAKAVKSAVLSEKLAADGAIVIGGSPEEFSHHLALEGSRWKALGSQAK